MARLGDELVLVKVKIRRGETLETPEGSVTANKSQRLISVARDHLQKNNLDQVWWPVDLISIQLNWSGSLFGVSTGRM